MLLIENTEVFGWEAAIRGMRNPYNSWNKSDSQYIPGCYILTIGPNDLKLMQNLSKAGPDHGKFLRMINVACDITAPVYMWAEIDTYKVSTVRNSCSFMHKGVSKPFELNDFTIEHGCEFEMLTIIETLNYLRHLYLESKDFKYFRMIRQLLPQGYLVKSTWQANYQVLKNIYYARKNHRLLEWHTFCDWIEALPYFKEICIDKGELNEN